MAREEYIGSYFLLWELFFLRAMGWWIQSAIYAGLGRIDIKSIIE